MHILKKGNRNAKSLTYTSLVRPMPKYGAACYNPYREGQINALDRVQTKQLNLLIIRKIETKAAQFANYTKDSN